MEALSRATHIEVSAGVRYWEDAKVNGVGDEDGSRIPGKVGERWGVKIDLASGRVENWPAGTAADIHYKVCDDGDYWLTDSGGTRIAKWGDPYVPSDFLCPTGGGFGDYIIMKVGPDGSIADYRRPAIIADEWEQL